MDLHRAAWTTVQRDEANDKEEKAQGLCLQFGGQIGGNWTGKPITVRDCR